MAMLGSFFKQRGIKQFHYEPRFYDEQKELREKRMRAIEQEVALGKGEKLDRYESNIRGAFQTKREEMSRLQRNSTKRFVLIAGVLLLAAYLFIYK